MARTLVTAERSKALLAAFDWVRRGQSQEAIVSAITLAAAGQIRPRPYLGPMFHAVLMMHAIDSAARRRAGADHWKPVLWAVDTFKEAQEQYIAEGGVPFGPAPKPRRAVEPAELSAALDAWDEGWADEAVTKLHETASKERLFGVLFRYAARDYRDIGHKSILVSGAWRLLQSMEYRDALPLLRSVVLGLSRHEGPSPPRDPKMDGTWARNHELAALVRRGERGAPADAAMTRDLMATFRTASNEEARMAVIDSLNRGAGAQTVWDAVACGAAELLLNRPTSLLSLHAVTTTDALALAWQTALEIETQRLLLLHAAGRLVAFRDYSAEKDGPAATKDTFEGFAAAEHANDVRSVLAERGHDASLAALGYLERHGGAAPLTAALHDKVLEGATNAHDYKLCEAVMEQLGWISPAWRPRFLAATLGHLTVSVEKPSARSNRIHALLSGANQ